MEKITVALAANANYGDTLLVAVGSLARLASVPIAFVVLDGGLTERQRQLVSRAIARVSRLSHEIRFVRVDDSRFRGYRLMNGNAMAYARLLLPGLLTEEWTLYCDADVIWQGDVAELWQERGEDVLAVATPDCEDSARKDEGIFGEYFCTGIMLMNLAGWRRESTAKQCINWLDSNPEARFWDQSAINHILKGRVKLIDKMWNRYVGESGPCRVMHYAGANPWRFGIRKNRLDRYKLMWFRELARLRSSLVGWEILRAKLSQN